MSGTKAELVRVEEKTAYNMGGPETPEVGQVDALLSPAEEKQLLRKIDFQ